MTDVVLPLRDPGTGLRWREGGKKSAGRATAKQENRACTITTPRIHSSTRPFNSCVPGDGIEGAVAAPPFLAGDGLFMEIGGSAPSSAGKMTSSTTAPSSAGKMTSSTLEVDPLAMNELKGSLPWRTQAGVDAKDDSTSIDGFALGVDRSWNDDRMRFRNIDANSSHTSSIQQLDQIPHSHTSSLQKLDQMSHSHTSSLQKLDKISNSHNSSLQKLDQMTCSQTSSLQRLVRLEPLEQYPAYNDDDEATNLTGLGKQRVVPWSPVRWLEARQRLVDNGKIKDLPVLMRSVRATSKRAMEHMEYECKNKTVDLSLFLMPPEGVRWFGRRNIMVPKMPTGFQSGIVEPPLIVVDQSPLDVVQQLQKKGVADQHPICVVVEVADFDKNGHVNTSDARTTSVMQQNLMVRTDFARFAEQATSCCRSSVCSIRDHLTAKHDPYVFSCPNVTMFRGSRDEGYPFLEKPVHITCIVSAMTCARPNVSSSTWGTGERTEWYSADADQTALLERLSLVGFVGLQNLDPDEKPILVLSALGCTDRGLHPKDAVANSLKHWRTRFARLFSTVFLACGPDKELAEHCDLAVNRQLYGALVTQDVSNLAEWHWDRRLIDMHINSTDFHVLARFAEANKPSSPESDPDNASQASNRQDDAEQEGDTGNDGNQTQAIQQTDANDGNHPEREKAEIAVQLDISGAGLSASRRGTAKDEEDAEEEEEEEEHARSSLLTNFSDMMKEHASKNAGLTAIDREVTLLYKETSDTSAKSPRGRMSIKDTSEYQRTRSMSLFAFHGAHNLHTLTEEKKARGGSLCSIAASEAGGSESGSRSPSPNPRKDGEGKDGEGDSSDDGSSHSDGSTGSQRPSVLSSGGMRGSQSQSRRQSIWEKKHSGQSRITQMQVAKMRMSTLTTAAQSSVNLKGSGSGVGSTLGVSIPRHITEAAKVEQIRAEARKRLSTRKDLDISCPPSSRGSMTDNNNQDGPSAPASRLSSKVRPTPFMAMMNTEARKTLDSSEDDSSGVLSRQVIQNDQHGVQQGPEVRLTVVELPPVPTMTCISPTDDAASLVSSPAPESDHGQSQEAGKGHNERASQDTADQNRASAKMQQEADIEEQEQTDTKGDNLATDVCTDKDGDAASVKSDEEQTEATQVEEGTGAGSRTATEQDLLPQEAPTEEWQVRMDLHDLAVSFKRRSERFWSNRGPKRKKVDLDTPSAGNAVGVFGRRASNETRKVEQIKSFQADWVNEQGERQAEANVLREITSASAHSDLRQPQALWHREGHRASAVGMALIQTGDPVGGSDTLSAASFASGRASANSTGRLSANSTLTDAITEDGSEQDQAAAAPVPPSSPNTLPLLQVRQSKLRRFSQMVGKFAGRPSLRAEDKEETRHSSMQLDAGASQTGLHSAAALRAVKRSSAFASTGGRRDSLGGSGPPKPAPKPPARLPRDVTDTAQIADIQSQPIFL